MKFSVAFLLVAILALLSVSATATAYAPRAVCYRKTQKCCYLFRSCGFIVKKLRVRRSCPYKVCKKHCHPVCYPHCKRVHVTVPYQKCYYKPVRVCHKVKSRRGRKWIWVEECKYERKRHCRTYYKKVWKRECHRVCKPKCEYKCYYVNAICVYHRIFHHPKFCPYLKCYRPTFVGPSGTPRHVISPKGKFVRATKPIRTDIRRKH